jgi:hypothetical protein
MSRLVKWHSDGMNYLKQTKKYTANCQLTPRLDKTHAKLNDTPAVLRSAVNMVWIKYGDRPEYADCKPPAHAEEPQEYITGQLTRQYIGAEKNCNSVYRTYNRIYGTK